MAHMGYNKRIVLYTDVIKESWPTWARTKRTLHVFFAESWTV